MSYPGYPGYPQVLKDIVFYTFTRDASDKPWIRRAIYFCLHASWCRNDKHIV